MIRPEKEKAIREAMKKLDVKESDITEKFIVPSSKGGQKANKTHNAVYLKHNPTGTEVTCRETRDRGTNRLLARRLLTEKLEEKETGTSKRLKEIEKKRKQKAKHRKRTKKKILSDTRSTTHDPQ